MATTKRAHNLESGTRFGRLIVKSRAGTDRFGNRLWICECDCGGISQHSGASLTSGRCNSCGCLLRQNRFRHGYARRGHEHPLYNILLHAKHRCENPKHNSYVDYGYRGIKFFPSIDGNLPNAIPLVEANIGLPAHPGLDLDLIDNDGNYEIGNLRWVTSSENMKNQRKVVTKCTDTQIVAEIERRGGWEAMQLRLAGS